MKLLIFVIACLTFVNCSHDQAWENFKVKFGKGFKSFNHETERKAIFLKNLQTIEAHNARFEEGLTTYKQGVNYYSDWTWEEFKDVILMKEQASVKPNPKIPMMKTKAKPEPSAKDWRSIMNPVKNQGHCGSCWAFGAIGAMEAAWYLAGNDRVVLSEQMLVDCGPGMGCDGGWVDSAFDHLIKNGAEAETDYPYTAGVDEVAGTCQYDNSAITATMSDYDRVYVLLQGVNALAQSIADNGPHAIYVYVNDNFRHYESGIFEDSMFSCSHLSYNHAVINVGYDADEGYWMIRNSWGADWGEEGHMRMIMGKNTCNAEHYAWVPKV